MTFPDPAAQVKLCESLSSYHTICVVADNNGLAVVVKSVLTFRWVTTLKKRNTLGRRRAQARLVYGPNW